MDFPSGFGVGFKSAVGVGLFGFGFGVDFAAGFGLGFGSNFGVWIRFGTIRMMQWERKLVLGAGDGALGAKDGVGCGRCRWI